MNTIAILIWWGGVIPAYRHARNNGYGAANSGLQSVMWPVEVGWHLADKFCADDKG